MMGKTVKVMKNIKKNTNTTIQKKSKKAVVNAIVKKAVNKTVKKAVQKSKNTKTNKVDNVVKKTKKKVENSSVKNSIPNLKIEKNNIQINIEQTIPKTKLKSDLDKTNGYRDDVNGKVEKLISTNKLDIKAIENLRKQILIKLEKDIEVLYKKRDFVAEVFVKRKELALEKLSVWKKIRKTKKVMLLRYLISMPFIYMMLIPGILLHIMLEIYHQICFRLYDIPRVNPKDYFRFDRRHLPYLNWFEKINCAYCSYYNALMSYAKEITGRTERYWCPIKHANNIRDPHSQYSYFVDYENGAELRKEWAKLKEFEEYREKKENKEI